MRFGIPLLAERVAPRCTFADSVLLVTVRGRKILERSLVPLEGTTWADLARVLGDQRVDTLVCGGISPSTRESIQRREVEVIDNVAGTSDEIVDALSRGAIRPGFGFLTAEESPLPDPPKENGRGKKGGEIQASLIDGGDGLADIPINCLECDDRRCLRGERCPFARLPAVEEVPKEVHRILEAATDIACESERTLCRLAELVYFGMDMNFQRLGVAYCTDLAEPAAILTGVLQRFFQVFPVCCKVGGVPLEDSETLGEGGGGSSPYPATACDPVGQAAVLNSLDTDLNIIVGLCMGVDCAFTGESEAPVTTIFVKDKSLANNPIGAVYSHYYLEDI